MTGGTIQQRGVYTWTDDDHFTYDLFTKDGDTEHLHMKIEYSRQ